MADRLGISGRIAERFQSSEITPLLALAGLSEGERVALDPIAAGVALKAQAAAAREQQDG